MKKFLFLLFLIPALSFAGFTFNKGSHSFIFDSDTSFYISPTTENFDADGLGYYVNDDPTFYAISEADLNKALNFKSGDEVMIVRKHNKNATHKTNLWKADKDDPSNNIYKIAGKGNGDVKFKVVATPYKVSGQPLPSLWVVALLIGPFLFIFFSKREKLC